MARERQPVSHLEVLKHWPEALAEILKDMPNRDDTVLGNFEVEEGPDGRLWNTFEDGCASYVWDGYEWLEDSDEENEED